MIQWEGWMEIKELRSQGHSIRAIAKMTGHSRNTVRKVLQQKKPEPFHKPDRTSKLDDFKEYAHKRYEECALSAIRIVEEIRTMGYSGSVQTVRRYLQSLRPNRKALQKMTLRFETPPGEQAQVDWGYAGRFTDATGRVINIYIFAMVLSFSRMLFLKFTTSMKLPVLVSSHMEGFEFFNGWPASILYDNMKQVRLGATQWNPLFLDFVSHYGIIPKTHRIRRPRTKGKIERMIDYIKDNFLNGRSFADLDDLNLQGINWLNNTANVRIHATTKQRPIDLFVKENLIAYSSAPIYRLSERALRKVDNESFVNFGASRYSVPPENVGKTVLVQQDEQRVIIRCEDLIIAEHPAAARPGCCIVNPEHIEQLCKLSLQRSVVPTANWQMRFDQSVEAPPLTIYEEVSR
jgi:transposase